MNDSREPRVRVYLAPLEDLADEGEPETLAEEDRARLAAITHPRRRLQFTAGRRLLRRAIEASSGIPPAEQRLRTLPSGRPDCAGGPAISLSHCGDWVGCAVATHGDVGIDLQFPVSHAEVEAIAAAYFAPEEHEWIAAGDRARFFMLWTLKEAYLKMTGSGLSGGLDNLRCRIVPPRIEARLDEQPLPVSLSLHAFGTGYLGLAMTGNAPADAVLSVCGPRPSSGAKVAAVRFVASTEIAEGASRGSRGDWYGGKA